LRTLLVASAAPGDGKTTIARQLDAQSGPGLADVLIGAVPLSEATQVVDQAARAICTMTAIIITAVRAAIQRVKQIICSVCARASLLN